MSKLIHLTPQKGLKVIDPATGKPLPEKGAKVASDTYWYRRQAEGDVTAKTTKSTPTGNGASQ